LRRRRLGPGGHQRGRDLLPRAPLDGPAAAEMTASPNGMPPDPATEANRRAFGAWLDDFFAHYYARRPVNATFIGVHAHDHDLPDFSPDGAARTVAEMR